MGVVEQLNASGNPHDDEDLEAAEQMAGLDQLDIELPSAPSVVARVWTATDLTVLFVTHNVREAVRLGDRVILLSSRPGRVAHEYTIDVPRPRRIDSPEVAGLAAEITDRLRAEVRRHATDATEVTA